MERWYIDAKQHLLGSSDAMLDDIRTTKASLPAPSAEIDRMIDVAECERAAIEALLQTMATHHASLVTTFDKLQQALSIAGAPLRGEIS